MKLNKKGVVVGLAAVVAIGGLFSILPSTSAFLNARLGVDSVGQFGKLDITLCQGEVTKNNGSFVSRNFTTVVNNWDSYSDDIQPSKTNFKLVPGAHEADAYQLVSKSDINCNVAIKLHATTTDADVDLTKVRVYVEASNDNKTYTKITKDLNLGSFTAKSTSVPFETEQTLAKGNKYYRIGYRVADGGKPSGNRSGDNALADKTLKVETVFEVSQIVEP